MATSTIRARRTRERQTTGTMISVRALKTPSRPGDETIPTVSIEKLVDLVHVVASLTVRLQVKMVATTATAGGKIPTAKILTADNKHRMLRSEVRKEASVAMADQALEGIQTIMVGKVTRVTALRIRLVAVSTRTRLPMGSTRAGTAVVGVRQTIPVDRDTGRMRLPAGTTWTGTTGTAAVHRVSKTPGTMTKGGRAVRGTGTRTRVSRFRLRLFLNAKADHRRSQGMMAGTTGRIVVGTIRRTIAQVGTTTTATTTTATTTATGDTTTVKAL